MDQDKGGTTLNLEQLQSMSDDELNELAAVKVMGWEKSASKLFWNERFTPHQSVFVKEIKHWNPTNDMNDAWTIMAEIKKSLFSKRKNFMDTLQEIVSAQTDFTIAWPDVLWRVSARDITIASILAKGE